MGCARGRRDEICLHWWRHRRVPGSSKSNQVPPRLRNSLRHPPQRLTSSRIWLAKGCAAPRWKSHR
eukprot:9472360-Pyramimonas_sp.AAC.1